jgi:apolipoprotein N-acyltransferase
VRAVRQQLGWGAAAVLLSAAALWHGTGLDPKWPLTWLAPVPVLAFALRTRASAAAAAAFAAWAFGGLNLWHYYRTVLGVPLPVVLVAVAVPAIAFAGLSLLVRALARRGRALLGALALPAGWTAFEFLLSRVSRHGTYGSLAYTQTDFLPLVQVASLVGISGITFVLMLVPSAVAVATLPMARGRVRIASVTGAVVAVALAYGGWRLARGEPGRVPVTVALAAADRPEQPAPAGSGAAHELLAGYSREVVRLASRGAEVLVLPETIVRGGIDDVSAFRRSLGEESEGRLLVLGADLPGPRGEANAALAFVPGSPEPAVYEKQHLLPPFESRYRPGRDLAVLDTRWGRLGLAICKDMDFPPLGRRYAQQGASLMLVPAWDFDADGWLHSRMAVLRGVEGGFAVARAARHGRLTISDDRGRIVEEAVSADAPVASILGRVGVRPEVTPYARLGDWFGWLSVLVFVLALVTGVRARSAQEVAKP